MKDRITYKSGYKYQLQNDFSLFIGVLPPLGIVTQYITLTTEGRIVIRKGYAWDGPSGPTVDTKDFMRGSLVHDALYQLMREGYLDPKVYRIQADKVLVRICQYDGMCWFRRRYVYWGVRWFADFDAQPKGGNPVLTAP